MPDYDFTALSNLDFEVLVRDLLQEELHIRLESFKAGKDQGIDLRRSVSHQDPGLVVQCKHFVGSGLPALLRHLKNDERPKIDRLNPSRYILTHIRLASVPPNKGALLLPLSPFCQGPHDILGKEDLNNLLGRFPEIERRTFGLWLICSPPSFRGCWRAEAHVHTEHNIDMIRDKMCRYVQNESYLEARELLETTHYRIVSGIPGIGRRCSPTC